MNADKCSRSNEIMLRQMTATRNVIKNKFRKACAFRLEHVRDANRALHSLITAATTNESESKKSAHDFSLRKQSKNNMPQLGLAIKSDLNKKIKSCSRGNVNNVNNPNKLCAKLRKLLNSQNTDSPQRTREIRAIVNKLHELEILTLKREF